MAAIVTYFMFFTVFNVNLRFTVTNFSQTHNRYSLVLKGFRQKGYKNADAYKLSSVK
jgi:hypothetical protein